MKTISKCLSKEEFEKYTKNKNVKRKIDKIILHHTWGTGKQWVQGQISCAYYKNLYENKGWKSGPHLFVAPEGIWLFTDIVEQGRHANAGNEGSIGIEMVGRYDDELPAGKIWENTKLVIVVLLKKFNLKPKDIHFHREYNPAKSCPGRAVTKKWVKKQITNLSVRSR